MNGEMSKTSARRLAFCLLLLGLTSNAPAAELPKQCNESVCFIDEAGKKEYEKENTCLAQDNCDYAVSRVEHQFKNIPKTNPTYGFYRNQVCIADKACSNRSMLENKKWLTNVVQDFITPLVEEEGEWKAKKKECATLLLFPHLNCQKIMARYHISEDLQNSVNRNGCGTLKDWDQVGIWLKACIEKGVQEDVAQGLQSTASAYASYVVAGERKKVRDTCIKYRSEHALPIEGP